MKKVIVLITVISVVFLQLIKFPTDVSAAQSTPGGYICSTLNLRKVIDVNGGNTGNGTKIQLWDFNRTSAQAFRFEKRGRYYAIVHVKSGKVLDVDGGNSGKVKNGTRVILWSYHGGKNQLWKIRKSGSEYSFQSALGNYYLDVNGGRTSNGTQIQIYQGNGTRAQRFKIQDDVTYTYKKYRLKFNTLDEWNKAMKASQQNAVGITGRYIYNSNGSKTMMGGVITGVRILSYKTIYVRAQVGHNIGMYRNVKYNLPYEIEYTIHKHHLQKSVHFCVEDLKCTYSCTCGYHDVYSWVIPWPDKSDFKEITAKPTIKEYHKNAFW